jgi:hypothetical protein
MLPLRSPTRSLLACSLALFVVAIVTGGGCANGGDSSATGDDDSSTGGDDVVASEAAPTDAPSSCSLPKKQCGTTCSDPATDPKNCGACGTTCGKDQVCTGGACTYSCPSPETLCNPPKEAGAGGGEGGSSEGGGGDSGKVDATTGGDAGGSGSDSGGGTGDSGAKDAAPPEAGPSDAASDAAGDGGSTAPYCANLGNDNFNCGSCGKVCLGQHTCNNGVCGLTCGPGQKACIAGDVCITTGTCCSSADCAVTGEICPQPGGQCQCPGGESVCAKTNSCISSSDCCTDADCASMVGATCPTPGQSCQCSTGEKACLSTKKCVAQSACCSPAGACCDDALGKSCSAATVQGPLALGQTVTVSGLITATGQEDWVEVDFTSSNDKAFHAHIQLTTNPSSQFVFEIASDCLGADLTCPEGGACKGKTDWEIAYTGGDPLGSSWAPVPTVGKTFVRVYRAGTTLTCDSWTLTISE